MTLDVKMDQLQDAMCRHTLDGWEVQRVAYVSGLSGDYNQRMAQAISAEGVPALRASHPSISGIFVTALQAEAAGPAAALVRITYSSSNADQLPAPGEPAQIQIGATLSQTTTHLNTSGEALLVTLGDGEDAPSQIAQVCKLVPQTTVRYTRLEEASPGDHARQYVGKINLTEVFGSAAGTWMCTAINGRSTDGGQTYEVTYDFQYKSDGWQPRIVYIDPSTGRPHPDATETTATIYQSIDFTNLEL